MEQAREKMDNFFMVGWVATIQIELMRLMNKPRQLNRIDMSSHVISLLLLSSISALFERVKRRLCGMVTYEY